MTGGTQEDVTQASVLVILGRYAVNCRVVGRKLEERERCRLAHLQTGVASTDSVGELDMLGFFTSPLREVDQDRNRGKVG